VFSLGVFLCWLFDSLAGVFFGISLLFDDFGLIFAVAFPFFDGGWFGFDVSLFCNLCFLSLSASFGFITWVSLFLL